MRKRGKSDSNQQQIIDDLRKLGYSVCCLSALGDGKPDIMVGLNGNKNYLFEIKNESLPPSQRKLTKKEKIFHAEWQGQLAIVKNLDEILQIIIKDY